MRTTHRVRLHRFENLLEGLLVKGINQIVQTDITYFWMNGRLADISRDLREIQRRRI